MNPKIYSEQDYHKKMEEFASLGEWQEFRIKTDESHNTFEIVVRDYGPCATIPEAVAGLGRIFAGQPFFGDESRPEYNRITKAFSLFFEAHQYPLTSSDIEALRKIDSYSTSLEDVQKETLQNLLKKIRAIQNACLPITRLPTDLLTAIAQYDTTHEIFFKMRLLCSQTYKSLPLTACTNLSPLSRASSGYPKEIRDLCRSVVTFLHQNRVNLAEELFRKFCVAANRDAIEQAMRFFINSEAILSDNFFQILEKCAPLFDSVTFNGCYLPDTDRNSPLYMLDAKENHYDSNEQLTRVMLDIVQRCHSIRFLHIQPSFLNENPALFFSSIAQCTKLEKLELSLQTWDYQPLTCFSELKSLTNLTSFTLTMVYAGFVEKIINLPIFNKNAIIQTLSEMIWLEELQLTNAVDINSQIDLTPLCTLTNLKTITCKNLRFVDNTIQTFLKACSKLESLSIDHIETSDALNALIWCQNLHTLKISSNSLSPLEIILVAAKLRNLKQLSIKVTNQNLSIDLNGFVAIGTKLSHLTHLTLDCFPNLPQSDGQACADAIKKMHNLVKLSLTNSTMGISEPSLLDAISSLPLLEELQISVRCKFGLCDSNEQSKIKKIELYCLDQCESLVHQLGKLSQLEDVNLKGSITHNVVNILSEFKNLKRCVLRHTELNNFQQVANLISLKQLTFLEELSVINFPQNSILSLKTALIHLPLLKKLSLTYPPDITDIVELQNEVLRLKNLRELNIRSTVLMPKTRQNRTHEILKQMPDLLGKF